MIRKSVLAALAAFAALAALAVATAAYAHDYKLGELTVEHPWARASIGAAKAGAAYLTIVNRGESPDLLVAVASPAAEHVSLHTNVTEGGVAKMRPVQAIEVSPGEPTVLQPGGLHIMMMGLKARLVEGETFPLTLTFERAGAVTVEVVVEAPSEGGEDHDDHEEAGDS